MNKLTDTYMRHFVRFKLNRILPTGLDTAIKIVYGRLRKETYRFRAKCMFCGENCQAFQLLRFQDKTDGIYIVIKIILNASTNYLDPTPSKIYTMNLV